MRDAEAAFFAVAPLYNTRRRHRPERPDARSPQHNLPVKVRDGDQIKTVMAGLSVLRIGDDGKLEFVRKYDIDVGDKTMWWMGMVPLPT